MSHEALRRQLSASDNERKYQLISRATIRLFAESRGLTVSDDSIRVLAEDVNYRLREVVSVSLTQGVYPPPCLTRAILKTDPCYILLLLLYIVTSISYARIDFAFPTITIII